jgi:hypothetical protein
MQLTKKEILDEIKKLEDWIKTREKELEFNRLMLWAMQEAGKKAK